MIDLAPNSSDCAKAPFALIAGISVYVPLWCNSFRHVPIIDDPFHLAVSRYGLETTVLIRDG